jgi:hypothetical protein
MKTLSTAVTMVSVGFLGFCAGAFAMAYEREKRLREKRRLYYEKEMGAKRA